MNAIIFRLVLDMHTLYSQRTIKIKRWDTGNRLIISLTENGKMYSLEEGSTAKFCAVKPDGKKIYNDCDTIEGNTIEYTLSEQCTAAPGNLECEIQLYSSNGTLLTSPRFTVVVDETLYSDGKDIDSTYEANTLRTLIETAEEGEATRAEAEAERAEAEAERINAEAERVNAEKARVRAEEERAEVYASIDSNLAYYESILEQFGVLVEQTDSAVTNTMPIPTRSTRYAHINSFGGMTRKWEGFEPYNADAGSGYVNWWLSIPVDLTLIEGHYRIIDASTGTPLAFYSTSWVSYQDSGGNYNQLAIASDEDFFVEEAWYVSSIDLENLPEGDNVKAYLLNTDTNEKILFPNTWLGLQDSMPTEIKVHGADSEETVTTPIPDAIQDLPNYGKGVSAEYCNKVDLENGTYTDQMETVVLTSKMNWWDYSATSSDWTLTDLYCYAVQFPDKKMAYSSSLCSHFKNVDMAFDPKKAQNGYYSDHNRVAYCYFVTDKDFATFKAWLDEQNTQGNSVTLTYAKAEPTITSLPVVLDGLVEVEQGGFIEIVTDTGKGVPVSVDFQIVGTN